MDLKGIIRLRYSCRKYQGKEVDRKLIRRIVDVARSAPSCMNFQEWRFVVVENSQIIKLISEKACHQTPLRTAPVLLICCAETNYHVMKCKQLSYPIDVSIIIDHITLLATEAGLGTCWIGAFDEDKVKEICDIPQKIRVVELLTIGYPGDKPQSKKRLELDEILFKNQWGKKFD